MYWGDFLAIGILLFTTGFIAGWVLASTKDYESIVDEKRKRDILAQQRRYAVEQEKHIRKALEEITNGNTK